MSEETTQDTKAAEKLKHKNVTRPARKHGNMPL